MDKDINDLSPEHSSVSLRLADIQKRCSELLTEPDPSGGLSLVDEPERVRNNGNPYDHG